VRFCLVIFFVPDEFICEVLKSKSSPIYTTGKDDAPVMAIKTTVAVQNFLQSMLHYFESDQKPDDSLLQLKFRELVLTVADNQANEALLCYFCSLLKEPHAVSLQRVMENNFCFNLKLENFAKLSSRSLSAFKRDFEKLYHTSPGKWLMEKRLNHALHLLTNMNKAVSEAAFESGFENTSHFSRSFRHRFGISPASVKQAATV
jgi:AraC-like DNA-binding protein